MRQHSLRGIAPALDKRCTGRTRLCAFTGTDAEGGPAKVIVVLCSRAMTERMRAGHKTRSRVSDARSPSARRRGASRSLDQTEKVGKRTNAALWAAFAFLFRHDPLRTHQPATDSFRDGLRSATRPRKSGACAHSWEMPRWILRDQSPSSPVRWDLMSRDSHSIARSAALVKWCTEEISGYTCWALCVRPHRHRRSLFAPSLRTRCSRTCSCNERWTDGASSSTGKERSRLPWARKDMKRCRPGPA